MVRRNILVTEIEYPNGERETIIGSYRPQRLTTKGIKIISSEKVRICMSEKAFYQWGVRDHTEPNAQHTMTDEDFDQLRMIND